MVSDNIDVINAKHAAKPKGKGTKRTVAFIIYAI